MILQTILELYYTNLENGKIKHGGSDTAYVEGFKFGINLAVDILRGK